MNITTPKTLKVFNDDATFDKYAKWFMVPHNILMTLYVCSYPIIEDSEGNDNTDMVVAHAKTMHPDCVLVY